MVGGRIAVDAYTASAARTGRRPHRARLVGFGLGLVQRWPRRYRSIDRPKPRVAVDVGCGDFPASGEHAHCKPNGEATARWARLPSYAHWDPFVWCRHQSVRGGHHR